MSPSAFGFNNIFDPKYFPEEIFEAQIASNVTIEPRMYKESVYKPVLVNSKLENIEKNIPFFAIRSIEFRIL